MEITTLYILFTGIIGAVLGSFFTMLVYRWPRLKGESLKYKLWAISVPRSKCTRCGTTLGLLDLFPIFSYLFSRGRCRHCGHPIHVRYLLIELAFFAMSLLFGIMIFATDIGIAI